MLDDFIFNENLNFLAENIFENLNALELAKCVQVSKTWNRYFTHSKFWWKINLAHGKEVLERLDLHEYYSSLFDRVIEDGEIDDYKILLDILKYRIPEFKAFSIYGLPTFDAVACEDLNSLKFFLRFGENVDEPFVDGAGFNIQFERLLAVAFERKSPLIVKYLLPLVSDKNPKSKKGVSILEMAAKNPSDREMFDLIIPYIDDKNPSDCYGLTLLHRAAKEGNLRVFELITPFLEDKNPAESEGGLTPMHFAARYDNPNIVEFIRGLVSEKNPRDHQGKTPDDYLNKGDELAGIHSFMANMMAFTLGKTFAEMDDSDYDDDDSDDEFDDEDMFEDLREFLQMKKEQRLALDSDNDDEWETIDVVEEVGN